MCGIYGLAWRKGGGERIEPARRAARAMRESIVHRGPDGHGEIERDGLIFGHVRLAIIDLAGGAQPMAAGGVALSYNGECYNFPELMNGLRARGWSFASTCDSEVVLAGYSLDGPEFDAALNGMYAYAILDERGGERRLQLSVDPVGIKPLFVYEDDDVLLYASELRAIVAGLHALGLPVEVETSAVAEYLRLGWVPAPLTLLRNTKRLLPGERWGIDLRRLASRRLSVRRRPQGAGFAGDAGDLEAACDERLRAVVARQTISDVPLGFFLSGGIDSSLLLAVARELGMTAESFSISFVGAGHGVKAANEGEVARLVAAKLGSPFHVIEVDEAVMQTSLGETFAAMDQPLADPACLPLLLLSRFARQRVKVCLSGDGGDELFAGYPRHRLAPWKHRWQALPGGVRTIGARVAEMLPTAPGGGVRELLRKARVGHALLDAPEYVSGPFADVLPGGAFADASWRRIADCGSRSLMDADIDGQLAGQMLPKTDSMTMAASLECRVPLLDLELIELASAVPIALKRQGNTGKLPLRRLLSRYLPRDVTERPKHGFRVPLTSWFRGSMADEIRDRLLGDLGEANAFVPPLSIAAMLDEHSDGAAEHSIRIWSLLAFEAWEKRLKPGAPR